MLVLSPRLLTPCDLRQALLQTALLACGWGHTTGQLRQRPTWQTCLYGTDCKRWEFHRQRKNQGAERGSCDRAACPPPCRCASACGNSRRQRRRCPESDDDVQLYRTSRKGGICRRRRSCLAVAISRCEDHGNRSRLLPRGTSCFAGMSRTRSLLPEFARRRNRRLLREGSARKRRETAGLAV